MADGSKSVPLVPVLSVPLGVSNPGVRIHPNTYKNSKAPSGYVPGLGRGATGFTTRSDIGPARPAVGSAATAPSPAPEPEEDYSESNYDEFSGYSGSLFSNVTYEEDDQEADEIYYNVDERMDSRRKRRREQRLNKEVEEFRKKNPKIQLLFADVTRSLSTLSDKDWENLPDPTDQASRNRQKKPKFDRFTPVPDRILASAHAEAQHVTTLDPMQQKYGGLQTPVGGATTDLSQLGGARGTVLSLRLDRMSDSVSGQTVVDPKGYLTDLNSIKVNSESEISDIKRARLLLKSVITTNPKHAPGWVAAARLEETAGKLVQARKLIAQGCEACPENESVWLEAARLQNPENAKAILASALRHVTHSVSIWLRAADLENDIEDKKRVLRRALEFIPNSVKLWKTAIELEDEDDARIMLGHAVECVPHSVEMWLALAHLETYENARKVFFSPFPSLLSFWGGCHFYMMNT